MKKVVFIEFYIFLLSFTFFSCSSIPPVLDFPSNNDSQMVFTTPCEYQNKLVPKFSIDTTSFINNEGFCKPTSVKISLCVKNLSKMQILNLEISMETDLELITLSQKEVIYTEPLKDYIIVRFESFISQEKMLSLVKNGVKSLNIKNPEGEIIATFDGEKLNQKFLTLTKYL